MVVVVVVVVVGSVPKVVLEDGVSHVRVLAGTFQGNSALEGLGNSNLQYWDVTLAPKGIHYLDILLFRDWIDADGGRSKNQSSGRETHGVVIRLLVVNDP